LLKWKTASFIIGSRIVFATNNSIFAIWNFRIKARLAARYSRLIVLRLEKRINFSVVIVAGDAAAVLDIVAACGVTVFIGLLTAVVLETVGLNEGGFACAVSSHLVSLLTTISPF